MSSAASMRSEIWRSKPEIWPDFAKSEILAQSGVWLFCCDFSSLTTPIQISEGGARNLTRNLDLVSDISNLCQIPDFGKGPPKGVGAPPAKAGVHHPPLGILPGSKFWPALSPTMAAGTAKHMTAVVFHPKQPT